MNRLMTPLLAFKPIPSRELYRIVRGHRQETLTVHRLLCVLLLTTLVTGPVQAAASRDVRDVKTYADFPKNEQWIDSTLDKILRR